MWLGKFQNGMTKITKESVVNTKQASGRLSCSGSVLTLDIPQCKAALSHPLAASYHRRREEFQRAHKRREWEEESLLSLIEFSFRNAIIPNPIQTHA
jgi:hypothetical protein